MPIIVIIASVMGVCVGITARTMWDAASRKEGFDRVYGHAMAIGMFLVGMFMSANLVWIAIDVL